MITPTVDTQLMNTFLAGLSGILAADEHAVLTLDNAGWHVAKALRVPDNITLMPLPAYSPELNPVERLGLGSAVTTCRTGCIPTTNTCFRRPTGRG